MKKSLFLLSFALIPLCAVAQENNTQNVPESSGCGTYETNRFGDNWFIQIGAGGSLYLGGQNGNGFGSRIAPVVDLGVGKWITPAVGVRLQFNYAPAMRQYSASYTSPFAQWEADAEGQRLQKFNFFNTHADLMWNLSTAIGGYKENRFYEIIPYVGLGYGTLFYKGAPSDRELTANLGIINKFRVSRTVDINLELRGALANGRFDNSTINNRFDAPMGATVGATFRLGKVKGFKRTTTPDYLAYQSIIKVLESENSSLNDKTKQLTEEVEALKNREAEVVTVAGDEKTVVTASPVALFFDLNKTTLDSKELANLDFYVKNAIKADSKKVFVLIGSADNATGTAQINQRLSEERMEYVHGLLVKKYGINKDRLKKKAEGDTNNRFSEPALNRVVIIE